MRDRETKTIDGDCGMGREVERYGRICLLLLMIEGGAFLTERKSGDIEIEKTQAGRQP